MTLNWNETFSLEEKEKNIEGLHSEGFHLNVKSTWLRAPTPAVWHSHRAFLTESCMETVQIVVYSLFLGDLLPHEEAKHSFPFSPFAPRSLPSAHLLGSHPDHSGDSKPLFKDILIPYLARTWKKGQFKCEHALLLHSHSSWYTLGGLFPFAQNKKQYKDISKHWGKVNPCSKT